MSQPSNGWLFLSLRRFSSCSFLKTSKGTRPAFPPESILGPWEEKIKNCMCLTDFTQHIYSSLRKYNLILLHKTLNLLTCDWPGLRGGERSSSETFPPCCRLLGGDWSESEPRLVFERIRGGDWSESEAPPFSSFFRGGDWSESESCLPWAFFARGDRWRSGFLFDDEPGFLLAGDESNKT